MTAVSAKTRLIRQLSHQTTVQGRQGRGSSWAARGCSLSDVIVTQHTNSLPRPAIQYICGRHITRFVVGNVSRSIWLSLEGQCSRMSEMSSF